MDFIVCQCYVILVDSIPFLYSYLLRSCSWILESKSEILVNDYQVCS